MNVPIGERIRILRTGLNITQEELGNKVGVQRAAINKYEKGVVSNIKRDIQIKLADALCIDPATLFYDEEFMPELYSVALEKSIPVIDNRQLSAVRIPVLGRVQAGIPVDAIEEILDWEEITPAMAQNGTHFALQIKGDSMAPRITEGDVVIVRQQSDIECGDVAVIIVNGNDATIKEVKKYDEGGITLVPFNPSYPVKRYSEEDVKSLPVEILGKVIELRAKF
ncbi:repressor LexA [Clostridiales Family XIII bacterium PM5-7]